MDACDTLGSRSAHWRGDDDDRMCTVDGDTAVANNLAVGSAALTLA
jgi:hypothetical protein